MSEGEEIKKGTPPSRISEVPLTPEEKSAEVDKALEAMKRSLERRLALKRPEIKSDIPPVLDTPDVDASQAKPIRRASGGAGSTEPSSNKVVSKVENAGARKDLSDFVDGLSEGEEFVVKNKDQEPTSYWKKAGRRKGEVRLENAQGDHSRGDIIKILTKGGRLDKKDGVITGSPASVDATTVDTDVDTSKAETIRMSQLASAMGELPDTDTPEVTALKKEGAELLAKKDKLTDDEVKEFEGKVNAILSAPMASDKPLGAVKAIKRNLGGATPDTALDPNSDAVMIALRREKLDQKERVNSLFNKLVQINTDESRALVEEALKLLAELTIQADEAKVKAFEEKAQTLINRVEKKERFELHEGDVFERTVDGKTEGIRITGLAGKRVEVYYKTNFKDGSKSDETFGTTIDKLQKELREEGFTRGSKMNFSESTRVDINLDALTAPDATFDEALAFQPLKPGEQAVYKGTKGDILLQRGAGDLYQLSDDEGESGFVYDEEHIRNIAQEEKWQRVGEVVPAKVEVPKKTDDSAKTIEQIIEDRRTTVGEMRLDYVTTDYKQNSAWQKIRRFFGKNLSESSGDTDTESARARYENALMNLQEAQLAQIKTENLTPEALRERMAGMLRYFKYDEQIKLADTRNQVKIENLKFSASNPKDELSMKKLGRAVVNGLQRGVTLAEKIGRFYNQRSKWEKLAFAGVALGTGFMGGAAVAGGLVVVRRALATAGLAVTMDTGVLAWQDRKRKKDIEDESEDDLKILDQNKEGEKYDFELLDNFLKRDIRLSDEKFQARKRQDIVRRSAVWGASVAGMLGFSYAASHFREWLPGGRTEAIKNQELKEVLKRVGGKASAAAVVSPTEAPASAAEVARSASAAVNAPASSAPASAVAVERALSVPGTPAPVASVTTETGVRFESLRDDYNVTGADRKQGLWGVIKGRLPDNIKALPVADQNKVIAKIEELMERDLAGMTKEEQILAGFEEGDLSKIYADKTVIRFDQFKSLTPEKLFSVLNGDPIGPSGATHIVDKGVRMPDVVIESPRVAVAPDFMEQLATEKKPGFERVLDKISDKNFTASVAANDASFAPKPAVSNFDLMQKSYTDPMQFMIDNPGQKQVLKEAVGKLRMEIFMMNPGEGSIPMQYDYALNSEKLGGTQVSQVLKDLKGFERFSIEYDRVKNPLHYDQMKELSKFIMAAEKAFPEYSQPQAGEDIKSYTSRMATAALRTGKAIKGFYIPGVANKLAA